MKSSAGSPEPLGVEIRDDGCNFALFAPNPKEPVLCIFDQSGRANYAEFHLFGPTAGVWHIKLSGVLEGALYAYRINGVLLADPYARVSSSSNRWGDGGQPRLPLFCRIAKEPDFDWQGILPPRIPLKDLVLYEAHVRGFTIHPSSATKAPGTFLGMVEKIPYLKRLGINAVELMPIFEFDETDCQRINPKTGRHLVNYWGYSPIHFFLPMGRYALNAEEAIAEFKTMVREFHREGIEVILDVVYNHTGEDKDYLASFRGVDKEAYYLLNPKGADKNYSGCGNTFKCNGKGGMDVILESMRYWAGEMRVDGFRFDLASIMTRGIDGKPLPNPPLIVEIAKDPLLSSVKLIAEAWDAAGLYQLGQFSKWGKWSSWNGRYRDNVRKFIKGSNCEAGAFATALCGSEPTYEASKTPLSSINFITAHDGYSLRDLVSYQNKHNEENGENNRDGANANYSWNCGVEGPSDQEEIKEFRERQMRNFWLALFLSQGVPLFPMGDEIGQTRMGNNNPYVQDNEMNWLDWNAIEKNKEKASFVSALIAFRKAHSVLRRETFLSDKEIQWHGQKPFRPDWSESSRLVAFTLIDRNALYAVFNANYFPVQMTLPPLQGQKWRQVFMSANQWDEHYFLSPEKAPVLGESVEVPPYSSLLAKSF